MIYQLIRELVRLTAYVFYRRIEVVGLENIPAEGATIFYGNHPNSLLDPALITAFGERKLHFMAKEALFSKPMLSLILKQMGAVPIKRRQDQSHGELNNESSFEALYTILRGGGAMGIFPEGISHDGAQLAELKTGAARIAIEMAHQGVRVRLVPCGLTYLTRDRFRSSVLIQFGAPIIVDENTHQTEPRTMTKEMEQHLRALTVNGESWEELTLLDTVRRLYQPPKISLEQRVALSQRFNQYYPEIRDLPNISQLAQDIQEYQERLFLLGFRDREINSSLRARDLILRFFRHLTLTIIWLPFALIGSPIHFPLAFMLGKSSRVIAPRKDVIATTKFIAGFLLLNTLYLGLGWWAWLIGWEEYALLVPLVFALSGYGCLKIAERGRALVKTLWIWAHCFTAQETIKSLRKQRRELKDRVHQAVDQYLPAEVDRMFYQDRSAHTHAEPDEGERDAEATQL